jgi:hypothetical protein
MTFLPYTSPLLQKNRFLSHGGIAKKQDREASTSALLDDDSATVSTSDLVKSIHDFFFT